jgi:hypothetical protein
MVDFIGGGIIVMGVALTAKKEYFDLEYWNYVLMMAYCIFSNFFDIKIIDLRIDFTHFCKIE